MSDKIQNQINEKIQIPKLNLWLIWLILFVFPSIISTVVFNYFIQEYSYFAKTDLISKAFEDIKIYNELTVPENYLEQRVNEIRNFDSSIKPELLKQKIDETLCGETILCIFFDEKANNMKTLQSKNIAKNIPQSLPTYLIKKQLKNLIEVLNNKQIEEEQKEDILYPHQTKLGITLQQTFKTASNIIISENKVSKNFSVLFNGELYFILCKFKNENKECNGFFAVLQGSNFSFRKMIENLQPFYPNIRIIFKRMNVYKDYKYSENFNSGIEKRQDGLFIVSPLSSKAVRHVAHDGTAYLNLRYKDLLPFIEYQIPINKTNNSLLNNYHTINLLAIIIIITSGIYCLNISLFSFNDNLSFKNKIIILALITALFPFVIFYLGIYTLNRYDKFIKEISIKQHAETELQYTSQELNQYTSQIEKNIGNKTSKISELISNKSTKPSELLKYLTEIGEEIPASYEYIYLKETPNNLKIISEDNRISKTFHERISKSYIDDENEPVVKAYPQAILESVTELKTNTSERKDQFNFFGKKISNTSINEALLNDGKMFQVSQSNNPLWLIFQQLQDLKSKNRETIGVFLIRFEPKPILEFFYKGEKCRISQKKYKEIIDDYEINYAFLPIEKSGKAPVWNKGSCSDSISEEDKSFCLKTNQSGELKINSNKIIIKKINQTIPHLALAVITKNTSFSETWYFLKVAFGIIVYLSLVLYFATKLLDKIFIQPVMLLAANALAIANGSEDWNTELNSGDEFEDLNNSFKNLVIGLKERNILKSYVSEDAFSDIKENNEANLKPGGEYMEATIVFSAIKDYDKLSQQITPQESIQLLSKFMSIAEEASKKYSGSIDKIIGDTIMLVFRNNPTLPSHALRASQASLELVEKVKKAGLPNLYTGIASGKVISGKIGSYSGKLDFTVIGNPVNLAARLKTESKNGTEQTGIIISGTTIELTKGKAKVKFLRRVAIKGKSRMYNIYELVGIR